MQTELFPLCVSWLGIRLKREEAFQLMEMSLDAAIQRYKPELSIEERMQVMRTIQLDLIWCDQQKVHIIPFFDPLYPQEFFQFEKVPLLLCVQGDKTLLNRRDSVTVVGTRNPSMNYLTWMDRELGNFLDDCKAMVISGGARGVDQKAHSLALRKGMPNLCFLPSGLRCLYPQGLESWRDWMLKVGGAFVSAYGPSQVMQKFHFAERNHLMAAIGGFSLILGARERSGTMITANAALSLHRNLGVVPDFPSESCAGSLKLLRDGANPIVNSLDIKSLYGNSLGGSVQAQPLSHCET